MAFTEDLDVFFDTVNGFAENVTYDGTAGIAMIFDAAFFEDELARVSVESSKPAALARDSDLGTAPHHDKLIVRGATTYKVVEVHPDGTGLSLLVLEEQ